MPLAPEGPKASVVEQLVYREKTTLPPIHGPLVSAFVHGVLGFCLLNKQISRLRGDQGLRHEDQRILSIDASMGVLQYLGALVEGSGTSSKS